MREALPGANVPQLQMGDTSLFGVVISPRFRGRAGKERQRLVDKALRDLTPEESLKVGIIVGLTPEEASAHPELTGADRNSDWFSCALLT